MRKIPSAWLVAAGLILAAIAWRYANWRYSIAPNVEVVTASALVAATFLGRRMALAVPLAIMAISDILIGNTMILLFTWSAFALIGLSGLTLRRWESAPAKLMLGSVGLAVFGSVFFFVYTNFGVWLLGDGSMYAKTWSGLMACYMMGLPFYRSMLIGNLVLVPAYFGAAVLVRRWLSRGVLSERASVAQ